MLNFSSSPGKKIATRTYLDVDEEGVDEEENEERSPYACLKPLHMSISPMHSYTVNNVVFTIE